MLTNTTTTKKTTEIGAGVTCTKCGLTYGDHSYGCPNDTSMRLLPVEARTLRKLARSLRRG